MGLASFPISLIKGFRSLAIEEQILSDNQSSTQAKINALRNKVSLNCYIQPDLKCYLQSVIDLFI